MHDIRPILPALFSQPGDLLYIGARIDAHSWLTELIEAGNKVYVLEISPVNCSGLLSLTPRPVEIWLGDVVDSPHLRERAYDYAFWWHGPEHVPELTFPKVIDRLTHCTRNLIAVAAPWGIYPQDEHAGNRHEEHLWSVYPESLIRLGFITAVDGAADQPGSEVVGWKRR